jgi:hypothetical protein
VLLKETIEIFAAAETERSAPNEVVLAFTHFVIDTRAMHYPAHHHDHTQEFKGHDQPTNNKR